MGKKKKPPADIYDFDADPTIEEIAAAQGVVPIRDPKTLHGDFWPEDEPIEDFLAALDEWRGRNRDKHAR